MTTATAAPATLWTRVLDRIETLGELHAQQVRHLKAVTVPAPPVSRASSEQTRRRPAGVEHTTAQITLRDQIR